MSETTSLLHNDDVSMYGTHSQPEDAQSATLTQRRISDDTQEEKGSHKKEKRKKHKTKFESESDDDDYEGAFELHAHEEEQLLTVARSKYDMKNHMANERTFFKYLFTGLHVGSIGTLVLNFFPSEEISRLYLVVFIWMIAFGFMFWGLYGYYRRKYLMESGQFKQTELLNPHMPLVISGIFLFVVLCVCVYAIYSGKSRNPQLSWRQLLTVHPKTKITGKKPKIN